jgi:hypothetical protein
MLTEKSESMASAASVNFRSGVMFAVVVLFFIFIPVSK